MLPLTRPTAFSYALFFVMLVVLGVLHLTTPFVVVMFAYLALNRLDAVLHRFNLLRHKWLAVVLFLVVTAVVSYGFYRFARRAYVVLPPVVDKAIPAFSHYATDWGYELPFEDMDGLRDWVKESVKDALGLVGSFAFVITKQFIILLIGIVVAVGIFLNPELDPDRERHPSAVYSVYAEAVAERFRSFYRSFRTVIGAQVMISAINTTATAVFVIGTGMRRYAVVVIILTFLCGLLPVIGNLISNTIIVGVALTITPKLALWAFVFLVVIHKLEYFLNSKIIGARIRYPMWLTLLALILGERLLGIAGIILAPVILNFIKVETTRAEVVPQPPPITPLAIPDGGLGLTVEAGPTEASRPEITATQPAR